MYFDTQVRCIYEIHLALFTYIACGVPQKSQKNIIYTAVKKENQEDISWETLHASSVLN
jgi:hypothetical protein